MYISQILSKESGARFCVIDSRLEELPPVFAGESNIHFVKGSLFSEDTYERARLHEAKFTIIYPHDCEDDSSDGATESALDIATAYLDRTCKDGYRPRFMCYLVNPDNSALFDGKEKATLVPMDFEIMLGVQESHDPGTANMIRMLLCNDEGVNPHTVVPRRIIGLTWADLRHRAVSVSNQYAITVNVLALIRDGMPSNIVDPTTNIKEGDRLSILALEDFNWEDFEKKIAEIEI